MENIKIYIIRGSHRGKHVFKRFSPDTAGRWGNIVSVDDMDNADFLVIIDTPFGVNLSKFPPNRQIWIRTEPDAFRFTQSTFARSYPESHRCSMEYGPYPFWTFHKTYDELINMKYPEKTRDIGYIVSNIGDGTQAPEIEILEGHALRWKFIPQFINKYPAIINIYGRGLEKHSLVSKCFKGAIDDKWDVLKDCRYAFAFENHSQNNYLTEKLTDAILAGCMPIYWGCPNLEEYLPKNSFIRLDISQEDAPEQAMEIIKSDHREQHINDLYEAKHLLMTKYSTWPTIHRLVNQVNDKLK